MSPSDLRRAPDSGVAPEHTAAGRTPVPADEAALLARCRQGEHAAFAQLIAPYRPRLARLLATLVDNPSDVDDLVQETCIRAYRGVAGFRGDARFYTWLYRIASNQATTHRLAQGRRPPMDGHDSAQFDTLPQACDLAQPESQLVCRQMVAALIESMSLLPGTLRAVIVLRELDGLSYAAIARALGCPVGTVRSRIARARAMLAADLGSVL